MKFLLILIITISYFFNSNQKKLRKLNTEYDIIIIGGGLAGLTAAYESNIKSNGLLKILLIEKTSNLGGNTIKASSGINLLETEPQKINNIRDNYDIFYSDIKNNDKNINNSPPLVTTLINGAKNLYDYYKNNFGTDTTLLNQLGGHSTKRTHRPNDLNYSIGSHLINKMSEKIKTINNIKIIYDSTVTELLKNESTNEIYGLKYISQSDTKQEKIIYCKAIILATGGYGHDINDDGLIKEFNPNLINYPTTSVELSNGSGIKLGRKIGAELVNMNLVQINPTGFINPKNLYDKEKILAPELFRSLGGILINEKGERFCNELGAMNYITDKIIQNCKKQETEGIDQYESYLLLNEEIVKDFGINNFNYYKDTQGLIKEYSNFKEISNALNIDYNIIKNTITSYNDAFEKNLDEFNKTIFPYKFDLNQKIYLMSVTPSIYYTMGGLKINNKCEVINTKNEIIYGLYGAGEVTGGVHGSNILGGNGLTDSGVFGIISADSAVDYILDKINYENVIIIKEESSSKSISKGAIAGIIIGAIVIVVGVILGIKFLIGKKRNLPSNEIESISSKYISNSGIK